MEQEVKGAKKNSMSNDLLEQYENKLNDSWNELFCSKDFQYFDQLLNPLAQPIIKIGNFCFTFWVKYEIDEEDSMIKRMRCVTKQCSFKHSTDDNSTLNQWKEDIQLYL